jgi:hypothetical protein
MPNYDMKFSVSAVAHSLETDRELVKKWAYFFSEYLEPAANPPKGTQRLFSAEDLGVLSDISMYWESANFSSRTCCPANTPLLR